MSFKPFIRDYKYIIALAVSTRPQQALCWRFLLLQYFLLCLFSIFYALGSLAILFNMVFLSYASHFEASNLHVIPVPTMQSL